MALKSIEVNDGSFIANGNKYTISPKLSTRRYKHKCMLEIEWTLGEGYDGMMKSLRGAYNSLNGNNVKVADAAVKLYNGMQAIEYAKDREPVILRYCALFVNREGEDVSKHDEELNQEKINDWHEEGLDIGDFFLLAVNLVQGFKEDYLSVTPSSSQNQNKEKK